MTNADLFKSLLAMSAGSLPTILACVVAMAVVGSRARQINGATPWAFLGFGLALVMSIVAPFSGLLLQQYFVSHALSYNQNAWMFGVLGVINSSLHAAALIFLLVALVAGRRPAMVPPPLPPA